MRKVVVVVVVVAVVILAGLTLTGCSGTGEAPDGSIIPLRSYEIEVKDGRIVTCVALHAKAVSCDWVDTK